jgi:hypothetical protein
MLSRAHCDEFRNKYSKNLCLVFCTDYVMRDSGSSLRACPLFGKEAAMSGQWRDLQAVGSHESLDEGNSRVVRCRALVVSAYVCCPPGEEKEDHRGKVENV